MFSDDEVASILSEFPKFELSYETMSHKKVFNHDVILAIPEGKKCLVWFTSYKNDNVCFIMETGENNSICDVYMGLVGFHDKLVLGACGTIFYGTIFKSNGSTCFCIEDLYYYKGVNYSTKTFLSRLQLIKHILQTEISQQSLTNKYILFGLPLMNTDLLTLLREIDLLPYKISQLKYRWFETKKIMFSNYYKPLTRVSIARESDARGSDARGSDARGSDARGLDARELNAIREPEPNAKVKDNIHNVKQLSNAVFKVTADIQSDIYNLFIYKDGVEEFYDYAYIPDYETSLLMNKLFRNIKENDNLDALEESDDEDEFENNNADKYVYLDRCYKINCRFNYKFKKWTPISMAKETDRIISHNLLSNKI
jgi:hypothetical protein